MDSDRLHWGEWIKRRALTCGFRTQKALADRLQVTPTIVSGWLKQATPPRLRDASIEALGSALCVSDQVIKRDYIYYDPEDELTDMTVGDWGGDSPEKLKRDLIQTMLTQGDGAMAEAVRDQVLRRRITGMIQSLDAERLVRIYELCKEEYRQFLDDDADLKL